MKKLSKLSLSRLFQLMPVGAAFGFIFTMVAVTSSHAQSVFEDWESVDVAQGGEVSGWAAEWDFYHKGGNADNNIRTLNQTGHIEGFTKLGFIRNAAGGTAQTWATFGDTVFTNTEMSSDVGVTQERYRRVGIFTRFTTDINDDFSYYMARWQHDSSTGAKFELIRKTTLGAETVLVNMDVDADAIEGTYPRSFLSFSVKDIDGQAHLEATFIGPDSSSNDEYSISYIDSDPLGAGHVGVYGQTGSSSSRVASFDNFQAIVPEPASIGLMFGGLALMMILRRRRNVT